MSDPYSLSPLELATLRAVADANNYSLHAHSAEGHIMKKLKPELRGEWNRTFKRLQQLQLCYKHPTRGGMTYALSREGLRIARSL